MCDWADGNLSARHGREWTIVKLSFTSVKVVFAPSHTTAALVAEFSPDMIAG